MAVAAAAASRRHVGEIFAKDSKKSSSSSKLENMRNYTPKIFADFAKPVDDIVIISTEPKQEIKQETREPEQCLLIGDKQQPFSVVQISNADKELSGAIANLSTGGQITANPLFTDSTKANSDSNQSPVKETSFFTNDISSNNISKVNTTKDVNDNSYPTKSNLANGDIVKNGPTTENPLFNGVSNAHSSDLTEPDEEVYRSSIVPPSRMDGGPYYSKFIKRRSKNLGHDSGSHPWIPAPDYEEESSLDFIDEEDDVAPISRNTSVYRDNEGDDFAQYLRDDDEEIVHSNAPYTWRKEIRYIKRGNERKAQTEIKRSKKEKNGIGALFKSSRKTTAPSPTRKSNIRTFSFADSKLAGIIKKPKQSVKKRAAPLPPTHQEQSDYERFLTLRLGSDVMKDFNRDGRENKGYTIDSSDSKDEMGGKNYNHNSVFKKFTSKFRKSDASFDER